MEKEELKKLISNLEKEFGKGSLINFIDSNDIGSVNVFSTGSLILDYITGINGYPIGRIIEIFGPESSGKTTLALLAIASIQKEGQIAAFIDAEHSLDLQMAERFGVNLKELIVSQPDSGEQAMEIVNSLVHTGQIGLIVVDSVAALTPLVELEGRMDESTVGAQARLMAKSLRKLSAILNKTNTTIIFINQIRERIGVFFGNNETTPGGRSLRFFASLRIDIRLKERIKSNQEMIGQISKVKIVKNKLSVPYKQEEIFINYDHGIDKDLELVKLALKKEVFIKKGSWIYYSDIKLGQGSEQAKTYLQEQNLFEEVYQKCFENK